MFEERKEDVESKLEEIYKTHGPELFGDCLENVKHVSEIILSQVYSDSILEESSDSIIEELHGNSSGCIARATLYLADNEVDKYCGFEHRSYNDIAGLITNVNNTCSKQRMLDASKLINDKIDFDNFNAYDLIDMGLTD